ncbi:hemolymph lipopolysaccharide-binding protein-like [Nasonia vitripennis]|uniref:C-type lectin domain-containing protein n=1 Tax=Nasonia vitripennis TaxID=7425 RepID=A0A7M7H843_NASVI|nr:hemolymph lipopolysaccharide-binding protein-like [Nasonia vitripennis]
MRLYVFLVLVISIEWPSALSAFQDASIPSMILDSTEYSFMKFNYCDKSKAVDVTVLKARLEGKISCGCSITEATSVPIKDDYTQTTGVGAHKLHKQATTWNKARKICNEEGGHLAIINSKAEEAVLIKMLVEARNSISGTSNTNEAFVGVHDLYEEGDWVTLDGEPLHSTGFSTWTTKYGCCNPDNYRGRQNCGAIVVDGGMDDVFCDVNHVFFCEILQIC